MKSNRNSSSQRGYTLVEVLVGLAIFTVIILGALMIYDRSNKTFKQSVESSEMQQSTRVAYDKMVGDIRLAGFDFDRDGTPMSSLAVTWAPKTGYTIGQLIQPDPANGHTYVCIAGGVSGTAPPLWPETANGTVNEGGGSTVRWREAGDIQYQQPDEQIEYAGPRAITVRSNYDYESDKAHENGREEKLESAAFEVVTTGNDEIVTYALRSTNASANKDTISFFADVTVPRSVHPGTKTKEQEIKITDVDLTGKNPPYTLMRFTLDPETGEPKGTPIADNIRDMKLTYYSDTSASAKYKIADADLPLGAGAYDGAKPDDPVAGRDARTDIKAISLALVGMNPQADYDYTDSAPTIDGSTDTIAPNYRKYALSSVVVPRNLGRRGMREFNVDNPNPPEIQSVCTGGCNAVYVTWTPATGGGDVDDYSILSRPGACTLDTPFNVEPMGRNLDGYAGLYIQPGGVYSFMVRAQNKFGSSTSSCVEATVLNTTRPKPPTGLVATTGLANKIEVTFPPATANEPTACTANCTGGGVNIQNTMPGAEKRYYKIIRGTTENFQPADSQIVYTWANTKPLLIDGTNMKFTDAAPENKTANCQPYWYRIATEDYCARDKNMNKDNDLNLAISDFYPALTAKGIPGQAQDYTTKPEKPTLTLKDRQCNNGFCTATLQWLPVTRDEGVPNSSIYISKYKLTVQQGSGSSWSSYLTTTVSDKTEYAMTNMVEGTEYRASVIASDCVDSDPSDLLYIPCKFGDNATVSVSVPESFSGTGASNDPFIVQSPTSIGVTASEAVNLKVALFENGTNQVGSVAPQSNVKTATFTLPDLTPDVPVLVRVIATNSEGLCTIIRDVWVMDQSPLGCAFRDLASDSSVISLGAAGKSIVVKLKNQNNENVTLQKVFITWDAAKGEVLSKVTFNAGSGTGVSQTIGCSAPNPVPQGKIMQTKITVPSGAPVVTANTTTYTMAFEWTSKQGNGKSFGGVDVLNSVCIQYKSLTTGDVRTCSVAPNGGPCTEPSGTSCQ